MTQSGGAETVSLTLPSGREIQVRKPNPFMLRMLALVSQSADGEHIPGAEMSDAELKALAKAMIYTLKLTMVSPRISVEPSGPDEISPRGLSLEDAQFVVSWALKREPQQDTTENIRSKCGTKPRSARGRERHKGHR